MNRFRSSSVLFPAGLILLLAASCKGPSNEAEAPEPAPYSYDDPYAEEPELALEPDPEGPAVAGPTEDGPMEDAPMDDGSEAEEPELEAPLEDAEELEPEMAAAPEPDPAPSTSPAPPPPVTTTSTSSSSAQEEELSSHERLELALRKDADTNTWGVEPYQREMESRKPNVRDNYVFLLFGARDLTDEAWVPVDTPLTSGINYLGRGPGGWFHWDVAFSYGTESGDVGTPTGVVNLDSTIWELDFGITKIFGAGKVVRPYLGLGFTYLRAGGQVYTATGPVYDSGTSFGGYGRAGLALDVTKWGGLIGIDARYVAGTSVSFGDVDINADGLVASITFGYSW